MYSEDIKEDNLWLMKGDCLERMKEIPDGSVDLILTDPPYGTTACKWDSIIPLEPMWAELKRIIKPNGAIVLFGAQPFTSKLVCSNIEWFKYDWIWHKSKALGFTNAKNKPMNKHEIISVFSSGTCANGSVKRMPYYPQGLVPYGKVVSGIKNVKLMILKAATNSQESRTRRVSFKSLQTIQLKYLNLQARERPYTQLKNL